MDKELLNVEETVEITTQKLEEIPGTMVSDSKEPLENSGVVPEETTDTETGMNDENRIFEQLGSQYEKVSERATPDGGSITNSLEPAIKNIENSLTFDEHNSENYEENVRVGGLGGNGGTDLNTIDKTTSDEYEEVIQRDSEIKRVEIRNIENQQKVIDIEEETQGQQDDGKGILSNSVNRNGEGTSVNPETHVLDAHGGISCKVEETHTDDIQLSDDKGEFNSGDLLKDKETSSNISDEFDENDDVEVKDFDDESTENFQNGNESEEIPEENDDVNETPEDNDDMKEIPEENDDVTETPEENDENLDTDDDFGDEVVEPDDGMNTGEVVRIPGIADDEGHGDNLEEKKDTLGDLHYEDHGVFDGSDQAVNTNIDDEHSEPISPEKSTPVTTEVPEEEKEVIENSGNMGRDLDGYGEPEARSNEETNDIVNNEDDETNEEVVDPMDIPDNNKDITEAPEEEINEHIDEETGEESYNWYGNPVLDYVGLEAEEINVLRLIDSFVD